MERDPQAPVRRAMLVLTAGLFVFLGCLNFYHLPVLLEREEPRRSVRIAMASISLLSGLFTLYLLARDLRGRALPLSACLKPAWLVVGLNLVDAYYTTKMSALMVIGLGAVAMGLWGIATLVPLIGRKAAGS